MASPRFSIPLLLGFFLFTPTLSASEPESSHVQRIREAGKIVLHCFPDQQNRFLRVDTSMGAMVDSGNAGHFEGIDIEVLSRVAEILGVRLEVLPITEPSLTLLLDNIATGVADLAGGGLTITPQRQERFSLSQPYHESSDLILIRAGTVPSAGELWRGKAALLQGSSFDDALSVAGFPKERKRYAEFTIDTLGLLLDGEADFTFVDSVSLEDNLEGDVQVAYRFGEPRPLIYLLPKGSDLKPFIDEALEAMRASGDMDAILARYRQTVIDLDTVPVLEPQAWRSGDFR